MIDIKQFTGKTVTPKDDALLYDFLINSAGIFEGCSVTHLGSNQLRISGGRGIIRGRIFVVEDEVLLATLSDSGLKKGRLLIRVDLSNVEVPISFVTQMAAALPALTQEDINRSGSVYELVLATYDVDSMQVSNLAVASNPIQSADSKFSNKNHAHTGSDGTGKIAYGNLSGVPGSFPPVAHKHLKSEITDFPNSLPANGGHADTAGSANNAGYSGYAENAGTSENARHGVTHNYAARYLRDIVMSQDGQPIPPTLPGDVVHVYK